MRNVSEECYEVSALALERFSELRFWVYDLEATGLDTDRERITQIAGVPVCGGRIHEERAFSQLVYPGHGIEIPKEVQELTGITLDRVKHSPPFPNAWRSCVEAAKGCDLWVGQSVFEFDVPLLQTELTRHGMSPTLPPMLDTVFLATALLGERDRRWSTSALIQKFQVNIDGLRRHDALDDVKIVGRILLPMMELLKEKHADRIVIPPDKPVRVRRHPPFKAAAS
jgi:DNA polymerase III alpha subunit (gram-positive type)